MPSFSLVERPWIPILVNARASPESLSLSALFANAPQIWQLADPSPLNGVALIRFLLAILHRAHDGPKTTDAWRDLWEQRAFEMAPIEAYLQRWQHRFNLFDGEYPFYQTPRLRSKVKEAKPVTELAFERASERNRPLLFDHSGPTTMMKAADAARALLAVQAFSTGGLVSFENPEHRSARASPLVGSAVCVVRGANLFETLLLNWQRYDHHNERPYATLASDVPAWERDGETMPSERQPTGYTDLLTWQSRRVQLIPVEWPDGEMAVSHVVVMKGEFFPQSFEVQRKEPMVAYRPNNNPATKASTPWFSIGLRTDRLVWRDSSALIQSIDQEHLKLPILAWIGTLIDEGIIDERHHLPLDIFGAITDQARFLDWRHETLPLTAAMLQQQQVAECIRDAVRFAERAEQLLQPRLSDKKTGQRDMPMYVLCNELLKTRPDQQIKKETINALAATFAAPQAYWSQLDTRFHLFLRDLARDVTTQVDGSLRYGAEAFLAWQEYVLRTCKETFNMVVRSLGNSRRTMRAVAYAEGRLNAELHHLRSFIIQKEVVLVKQ